MTAKKSTILFKRYANNPIITAKDIPYHANTVFNAGAALVNGETILLLRIEDLRGISHLTVAKSSNGFSDWEIDQSPTFTPDPANYPEDIWGIEDPRITYLEERKKWGIVYTSYCKCGPLVSLADTSDFKHFDRMGAVLPPENKDAALFPVKFNGRWAMIHRPVGTKADIWIAYSPDLKHWGSHSLLFRAREGGWWDANKIGLSTPPLRTKEGWLILYHGVKETASGSLYRLGLTLHDLENPNKIICRSLEWVFGPLETYERVGDVAGVVFPCGWLQKVNELIMYYGGADTCIAAATANLDELVAWLLEHGEKY